MLAMRHCATMLFTFTFTLTLSSMLLVQVLASAPETDQNSVRSHAIDARDATHWLMGRHPESSLASLGARIAPEAVDEEPSVALRRDAAEAVDERAGPGDRVGDSEKRNLGSTLEQRKPDFVGMRAHERSSTPAMTSAAPTIFGISIYLVIAWLVLLYLMFRTGSISSTEDAKNYAEEIS